MAGSAFESQPNAPPPSPQSADMSTHVFPADTDDGEKTSATTSNADEKMARGPPCPSSRRSVPNDQPPRWRTGDVALWCERSASGGQRFSTVLVVERAAGESTPGPADAGTLPVTDGASTFAVDARDLRSLAIPAALVPRLLSNAGASPSPTSSPPPQTESADSWGWLSPAGLAAAEEDAVPVAPHAVRHIVGKGGTTARLIESICGIIVGVSDEDDGTAVVTLFGPGKRIKAARVIIQAMEKGAWSLPRRLKEHGFNIG